MTVREFDPVFSEDLRRELVSRSDAVSRTSTRATRPSRQRRQLWTTIATAAVLLVATLAVLQQTRPAAQPADGRSTTASPSSSMLTDPLTVITDPRQGDRFLSRSPRVLLHVRGTDQAAHSRRLEIPSDVRTVRIWLYCSDEAHFAVSLPHRAASGGCSGSDASPFDAEVQAGTRLTIDYAVPEPDGSSYALLVVALPSRG